MNDGLCIRERAEHMPARNQLVPQVAVAVDLAVEGDPDRRVFVAHRLVTAGHVDDAEAANTEAERSAQVNALVVRAAMSQALGHRPNQVGGRWLSASVAVHPADAAHPISPGPRSSVRGREKPGPDPSGDTECGWC